MLTFYTKSKEISIKTQKTCSSFICKKLTSKNNYHILLS